MASFLVLTNYRIHFGIGDRQVIPFIYLGSGHLNFHPSQLKSTSPAEGSKELNPPLVDRIPFEATSSKCSNYNSSLLLLYIAVVSLKLISFRFVGGNVSNLVDVLQKLCKQSFSLIVGGLFGVAVSLRPTCLSSSSSTISIPLLN